MKRYFIIFSFILLLFVSPLFLWANYAQATMAVPKKKEKSSKVKFFWLTNITAYAIQSQLIGSSRILGANLSGTLAPALQFSERLVFISLYDGSYKKSKQVFAEDEGPRLSSEDMKHTLTPTLRYNFSRKLMMSLSAFYTLSLSKQTQDDKWFEGLYDYREGGGGLQLNYSIRSAQTSQSSASITFQQYTRKYPNFRSLFSIAGLGSLEELEKDFIGSLVSASYLMRKSRGLSYSYTFSYQAKNFVDKLIETEIGGRKNEKQHNDIYTLAVLHSYRTRNNFTFKLDKNISFTNSNQNLAEGSFPLIVFQKDYFSSLAMVASPGISYTFPIFRRYNLTLSGAYSLTRVSYRGRLAKDREGNLTSQKEVDWTHNFNVNALFAINKHWSVGVIGEYDIVRSNMKDERTFRFNYELLNMSFGFSYRY